MFSLVQNINSGLKPLETKEIDARLENKSRDFVETDDHASNEYDDMVMEADTEECSILSVKAIILFLEDFLEARLGSKLHFDRGLKQSSLAPWLKSKQSNDADFVQPENAAKAYAHAAKTRYSSSRKNVEVKPSMTGQEDLKSVYFLIRDLRNLQDDGVAYLRVETERTFLDGIFRAVDKAKAAQEAP